MIKEFNSIEEIQKYYNKESNTYIFKKGDEYIDLIKFNFDLSTKSNIDAWHIYGCYITASNIKAYNINAEDIYALDINALNINVENINAKNITAYSIISRSIISDNIVYYGFCCVYEYMKYKTIRGLRFNSKYFVLDRRIEIMEE